MILCCGEALIDFLPVSTAAGKSAFEPHAGGSVHNVAIALGRLEVPTGFFGGLSSDMFGDVLEKSLATSNVSLALAPRSNRHTTLAFVSIVGGQPRYAFIDEASAGRCITEDEIPALGEDVEALHFGSFQIVNEPIGSALEALARQNASRRVITLDPNIRPTLVTDRDSYLARLARMTALADIVKLSDEDLAWMVPGVAAKTWAERTIAHGTKLVVLTKGAEGAEAFAAGRHWRVAPVRTTVADTVGAGDTFMAGLITALRDAGVLTKAAVATLPAETVAAALDFAARAAAITVSRSGADPPWRREIGAA